MKCHIGGEIGGNISSLHDWWPLFLLRLGGRLLKTVMQALLIPLGCQGAEEEQVTFLVQDYLSQPVREVSSWQGNSTKRIVRSLTLPRPTLQQLQETYAILSTIRNYLKNYVKYIFDFPYSFTSFVRIPKQYIIKLWMFSHSKKKRKKNIDAITGCVSWPKLHMSQQRVWKASK